MKYIITVMMALLFVMPTGYTARMTSKQTFDTAYIHINADHSTDEVYNCCEVELTYDAGKLRFNSDKSTIGQAAYRDADGRLMLADFGADKPLGNSVYVLAFEVVGTGKAEIQLCRAAFSTAEKAATEDIEPITNKPNSITVWVR
jgi:hypothetical protein